MQISIIRVLLKTPLRVLSVYPCSRRICPKNATGFVAQRSRLHWHLKQASLPNEASFIFSGYFLDMIRSVGFRVNSYQDGSLQVIGLNCKNSPKNLVVSKNKANISEHITNIYQQGELMQSATVRKF